MTKAVIFDLDDTLINEMDYVKSGFKEVSRQVQNDYGMDIYKELLRLFSINKQNVFNRVIESKKIHCDANYLDYMIKVYQNHVPSELCFYEDVQPTLSYLKNKGIQLGIITDGRVEGQKNKLRVLNAYHLFDEIIITDELGGIEFRKPNPIAYEILKEKFKVQFDEIIYIGDNPQKDFKIAQIYPIQVYMIQRKDSLYKFKSMENVLKIKSLKEIDW